MTRISSDIASEPRGGAGGRLRKGEKERIASRTRARCFASGCLSHHLLIVAVAAWSSYRNGRPILITIAPLTATNNINNNNKAQALASYTDELVNEPLDLDAGRPYALWAVVQGTAGCWSAPAARAAAAMLPGEIARRVPAAPLPDGSGRYDAATLQYATRLRLAVVAAFLSLHEHLLEQRAAEGDGGLGGISVGGLASGNGSGRLSGAGSGSVDGVDGASPKGPMSLPLFACDLGGGAGLVGGGACGAAAASAGGGVTATVVIQTGPLLTVCNVGSCRAVLDVGVARVELTDNHRVGCNEMEDARLAMGEREAGRERGGERGREGEVGRCLVRVGDGRDWCVLIGAAEK